MPQPSAPGGSTTSTTTPVSTVSPPISNQVYFTQVAEQKQVELVRQAMPKEIGWFGLCYVSESGLIVVDDVVVYEQDVSGGAVDSWDDAAAAVMEEYIDDERVLKLVGHSHNNMSAYFSPRDTDMIDEWAKDGQVSWIINYVTNIRGEYKMRIDQWRPFRMALYGEKVILSSSVARDWAKEEIERKVTLERPTIHTPWAQRRNSGTPGVGSMAGDHIGTWKTDLPLRFGGRRFNTIEYERNNTTQRKRFTGGSYSEVFDGIRYQVSNGEVVMEQDLTSGAITLYGEKELALAVIADHDKDLLKLQQGGTSKEIIVPPSRGRSVDRSEAKRAEGNLGETNDAKEEKQSQTQTVDARKRDKSEQRNGDKTEQQGEQQQRGGSKTSSEGSDRGGETHGKIVIEDDDGEEIIVDDAEASKRFLILNGEEVDDPHRVEDPDDMEQESWLMAWAGSLLSGIFKS